MQLTFRRLLLQKICLHNKRIIEKGRYRMSPQLLLPYFLTLQLLCLKNRYIILSSTGEYSEPHSVFPSKAITSPSLILFPKTDFAYSMNTFPSCSVSIFASTLRIVSAKQSKKYNHQYIDKTMLLASVYPAVFYCFKRFF